MCARHRYLPSLAAAQSSESSVGSIGVVSSFPSQGTSVSAFRNPNARLYGVEW